MGLHPELSFWVVFFCPQQDSCTKYETNRGVVVGLTLPRNFLGFYFMGIGLVGLKAFSREIEKSECPYLIRTFLRGNKISFFFFLLPSRVEGHLPIERSYSIQFSSRKLALYIMLKRYVMLYYITI